METGSRFSDVRVLALICLSVLTVTYVLLAPQAWWFSTDDAIYLASAEAMLARGEYTFNGLPNLFTYPGTSALLALSLAAFGKNFHALHLLFTAIAIAALWVTWLLFQSRDTKVVAAIAALLLGLNSVFINYVYYLRSDHLFLLLAMLGLWCWQRFSHTRHVVWLYATLALTAFAPLVRFQGLFLCGAFVLAFLWSEYSRSTRRWLTRSMLAAFLVLLPFSLWTLRNYVHYTPDAYNMALSFFFNLPGPALYAGEIHAVELDSAWMYPLARGFLVVDHLLGSLLNKDVVGLGGAVALYGFVCFLCISLIAGVGSWCRRASVMERSYVVVSLLFLLYSQILVPGNYSTVIVHDRYWLPMLPFFIYIGVAGAGRVIHDLTEFAFRYLKGNKERAKVGTKVILGALLVAVPAYSGANLFSHYASEPWERYWEERHMAAHQVKEYINEYVPPGATVAATDVGAIHYLIDRPTVTLIDSERMSLERIIQKHAQFLVAFITTQAGIPPYILEEEDALPSKHPFFTVVTKLVSSYPDAFNLVLRPSYLSRHSFVAIYRIDHEALDRHFTVRQ